MNQIKTACLMLIVMTLLTGGIYPALITAIAQFTMSAKANGSLIEKQNQIIGSALVAQKFTAEGYFWPRPSAVDYQPIPSGGSNLGPTSKKLKGQVDERVKAIQASFNGNVSEIPSELVYASGSGIDPHISVHAAYFQAERVAKARSLHINQLTSLINSAAEGNWLGFLNGRYVNVLKLNLELDKQHPHLN